ncbi:tyrosyl-tRNA synthetase [Nematocida major]|uniref:tyrosyl-tRNA synthetase n=1 Tax=Nematocida major TaxID=1912982 RepID=UPI0020087858|nr:tyrosyl-tRNA synthetase [Nematocida major]KAH9385408.1 tyrosyl-tRNA synthetase [Nematocida major]
MLALEQKHRLITRGLEEILGKEKLLQVLKERDLRVYWGTAPTGKPHIGYFIPIAKIADFLRAGCEVTVLIADLHAALDNLKAPLELIEKRSAYYEVVIKAMLVSAGAPIEKIRFVRGTDYQYTREYVLDMHRLSTMVSVNDARRAGAEVVKQTDNPILSGLVYPGMQALDEEHLKVDAQFGGIDQRKIFIYAEEIMPKLGYEKRVHLMNGMVPSLSEGKMSSSDAQSKIGLEDSNAQIRKKVLASFCEERNVDRNPVLAFIERFVFNTFHSEENTCAFPVSIQKLSEVRTYNHIEPLSADFKEGVVHPLDLKMALVQHLVELVAPVREQILRHKDLAESAYPAPVKQKVEKHKKKGEKSRANAAPGSTQQDSMAK